MTTPFCFLFVPQIFILHPLFLSFFFTLFLLLCIDLMKYNSCRLKLSSSCFGVNKLLLQKDVQVWNSYTPMHSAEQVSTFRVDFSENYIPGRKRSSLQILSTLYAILLIFSVAVTTKKSTVPAVQCACCSKDFTWYSYRCRRLAAADYLCCNI